MLKCTEIVMILKLISDSSTLKNSIYSDTHKAPAKYAIGDNKWNTLMSFLLSGL